MEKLPPAWIKPGDAPWPRLLAVRLGTSAPAQLSALGNMDLLALPKTAVFCSARWRDAGRCIISGFHSPIEKECLRILLRGSPPIIICPARALPKRIPTDWQKPLDDGRLLILAAFHETETRIIADLARRRNDFVAALADEAWFAHITPGGKNDLLTRRLTQWGIPFAMVEKE